MTTKREFRTVGAAMMAEARKTGRASLRGIVGGAMMAAALLVMTMGMAGCSSEGDDILGQDGTAQPKETAGVMVTVSAGISDGESEAGGDGDDSEGIESR